jgi:hypothetical protein
MTANKFPCLSIDQTLSKTGLWVSYYEDDMSALASRISSIFFGMKSTIVA